MGTKLYSGYLLFSCLHKLIVEDSTQCFTAMPDYVLIFKKHGINEVPVEHTFGLFEYAGETPLLPAMEQTYGKWDDICKKYKGWKIGMTICRY